MNPHTRRMTKTAYEPHEIDAWLDAHVLQENPTATDMLEGMDTRPVILAKSNHDWYWPIVGASFTLGVAIGAGFMLLAWLI